ncbi:MAG: DNA/RNA non-specific endonuclease, partial [Candidatus Poribacteria bacterium]|nr:DNA/RNA non-specific endonuclease [Candidatus Poribacteria bacterium]
TVPQWYYKIIVDYHQPEIKALAFMIPNRKPQKSLQSFVVSIDKLEEVTQLDFLNLLPQKVQEQL